MIFVKILYIFFLVAATLALPRLIESILKITRVADDAILSAIFTIATDYWLLSSLVSKWHCCGAYNDFITKVLKAVVGKG